MTEEIMRLSDIEPWELCPNCGSPYIHRSSVFDKNVALWDLHERCTMCNYSKTYVNVEAG